MRVFQELLACDQNGNANQMVISHPQDIADAMILGLEQEAAIGQAYNIGSSVPFNFGTLIPYMSEKLNMPYVRVNLPLPPYNGLTSNQKIRSQLGYNPKFGPFDLIDVAVSEQKQAQAK